MFIFLSKNKVWLWPILAFALITPFTPFLDLALTRWIYNPTHTFPSNPFYDFVYKYGFYPGNVLAGGALLLFFASFLFKKLRTVRYAALILALSLAIGGGLITHAVFKDHWGRPRPKQVIEFGGDQAFRPYYKSNFFHQPEPSKSFPCGHCSVGFYFFALAFVGRRKHSQVLFWVGLMLALVLGIGLSWTRIVQGAHFLSDTLASALIMWLTAYYCDRWLPMDQEEHEGAH